MKIAFFEVEDWEKELFKSKFKGHNLVFFDECLTEDAVSKIKDADAIVIFIYSCITKAVVDKLPKLKLIATMSTGTDHIDIAYCRKKGIAVANVPTYGENTVAEHTFALLLALSRRIYPSIKRTHEQQRFETDNSLRGFDLKGKTIGIVGLGHIGKHVARIAKGFEMNILVATHNKDAAIKKELGLKYVEMDELLKNSDVITLHVPYSKETHHLIDAKAIKKMKNGVCLINTARGAIVDTDALVDALESGKIRGAGLDVLEEESDLREEKQLLHKKFKDENEYKKILEDHMLMKMNNVIITPHNAFNSTEAICRIIDATVQNVQEYIKTKKVANGVTG